MTLVEATERIMLQDDLEAADVIAQCLVQDGVDLRASAALQRVEKNRHRRQISFRRWA